MRHRLVLASSLVDAGLPTSSTEHTIIRSGPRLDYVELAQILGAELRGYSDSKDRWNRLLRRTEKQMKMDVVEAITAALQVSRFHSVISLSEKIAIPLAALLLANGSTIPHITVAHKMSSGWKRRLFQVLPLYKNFSRIICLSRSQLRYAASELAIDPARLDFVYSPVDHRFFHPMVDENGGYVLAIGQEQRDYTTLVSALKGTGIPLVIVASSPWSTSDTHVTHADNVQLLGRISYEELRILYARATLVVVPLHNVDYAAGVNSLQEAMSMAKPVITSHTLGLQDYIIPNETGVSVPPGDPDTLREEILSLWDRDVEQKRLGCNARQFVEEAMGLERYVEKLTACVAQAEILA